MAKFLFAVTATLLCVSFFGCAGSPGIPSEKRQYIEGRMIEGVASGFRLRDAGGREYRILASEDTAYNPAEFHALYGDRLGVTYGTLTKEGAAARNVAVRVDLIAKNPSRIEIESPTEGVVRKAGKTAHQIYLTRYGLTVILLNDRAIRYRPGSWKPTSGNEVRVYITTQADRFMEKRFLKRIDLLNQGPSGIEDETLSGAVQEVRQDQLAIWTQTGKAAIVHTDAETQYSPTGFKPASGDRVTVKFYRKLTGDRSIRLAATLIQKTPL